MSRIGKKLVLLPATVKVVMEGPTMKVAGPKGTLTQDVHRDIKVTIEDGKVFVTTAKDSNKARAMWGLYRALLNNMVQGVEKGFEKKLEIEGVGFKAALQGDELVMNLGFVNPVKIKKPEGIIFTVEKNIITVSGIDKQAVGQIAAQIRATKKAEPYKGKGIKYQGEKIRRKEGKKVVATKK
jgi:large subunit ribosomal protein L6